MQQYDISNKRKLTLHDAIRQFIKRNASIYESQYNEFINKKSIYPKDNLIKFDGMDEDDDEEEKEEEEEEENNDIIFDMEDNDNNNDHTNNNNNNHNNNNNRNNNNNNHNNNNNRNNNNNNNNDDRVRTLEDIESKMKNILRQFTTLSRQIGSIRDNPPHDMIQYNVRRIQDTPHVFYLFIFIYIIHVINNNNNNDNSNYNVYDIKSCLYYVYSILELKNVV